MTGWLRAALAAALLLAATSALGLELRVPKGDPALLAAAEAIAAKVGPKVPLQVQVVADDAAALGKDGFALVRATAAQQAYAGGGRQDTALKSLRTVAVLGREVLHAWAKPERHDWKSLRGRPTALAEHDTPALRTVLEFAHLGMPELAATETADVVAAAKAGQIDAWLAVGLPDSPTAAALAALGWQRLQLRPEDRLEILDEGWPLQVVPGTEVGMRDSQDVIALPVVLVCHDKVARAVVEDLVDLLLPATQATVGTVPLLRDASRKLAAKPVPTLLHAGAAASYVRLGPLDGPIEMQVTIWLLDVGAIDVAHNTFDADFALELRWQDARLDVESVLPFEIMNEVELKVTPFGYESHGMWHSLNWRVQGKLRSHFDLMRFPFDRQRLAVEIEHPLRTTDELVYRCETRFGSPHVNLRKDRLGPDLQFGAWRFASVATEEVTMTYGQDEAFSRYRFVVTVQRALLPYFVEVIGPLLLLLVLAWSASLIPHEKIDAKLLLTVLALVVVVELQVAGAERAPNVDYPTFNEYLYLFTYLSIAVTVGQAILEYRLHSAGNDSAADKVGWRGIVASVAVFALPMTVILVSRLMG